METTRAIRALSALAEGRDPSLSAEEVEDLALDDILGVFTADTRDGLVRSSADLDRARANVQELRRALDQAWGPKGSSEAGGRATPSSSPSDLRGQLQRAVAQLDELSLARSTLQTLVPNASTGVFLVLRLKGRQLLDDLGVWAPVLSGGDLSALEARILEIRGAADALTESAVRFSNAIGSAEDTRNTHLGDPLLRLAGLIFAAQDIAGGPPLSVDDAGMRFFTAYDHLPIAHHGGAPTDRVAATALVASTVRASPFEWEMSKVRETFERLRSELTSSGRLVARSDAELDLVAASLTDLALSGRNDLSSSCSDLAQATGTSDALAIATLARSNLPKSEAGARFREALSAFEQLGYPSHDGVPAATALLASSGTPQTDYLSRMKALDPVLRGRFTSPIVADAALAALPLPPPAALRLHTYATTSLSRRQFFTETQEIDYHGLIIATALGASPQHAPLFRGALGSEFDTQGPVELGADEIPVAPVPAIPSSVPLAVGAVAVAGIAVGVLPTFLAVHELWLYRSYAEYARQHPVHSHMVPVYG